MVAGNLVQYMYSDSSIENPEFADPNGNTMKILAFSIITTKVENSYPDPEPGARFRVAMVLQHIIHSYDISTNSIICPFGLCSIINGEPATAAAVTIGSDKIKVDMYLNQLALNRLTYSVIVSEEIRALYFLVDEEQYLLTPQEGYCSINNKYIGGI